MPFGGGDSPNIRVDFPTVLEDSVNRHPSGFSPNALIGGFSPNALWGW